MLRCTYLCLAANAIARLVHLRGACTPVGYGGPPLSRGSLLAASRSIVVSNVDWLCKLRGRLHHCYPSSKVVKHDLPFFPWWCMAGGCVRGCCSLNTGILLLWCRCGWGQRVSLKRHFNGGWLGGLKNSGGGGGLRARQQWPWTSSSIFSFSR